jgi:hypothetical protein
LVVSKHSLRSGNLLKLQQRWIRSSVKHEYFPAEMGYARRLFVAMQDIETWTQICVPHVSIQLSCLVTSDWQDS